MKYYKRNSCRLCATEKLSNILSLTATPWADDYRKKENVNNKQDIIPLDIYLCENCGHAQLSHVIDAKEVYLNYTYETASTLGLGEHFKKTADTIVKNFRPKKEGLVIDIGSNRGESIKNFLKFNKNLKIFCFEPKQNSFRYIKKK